MLSLSRSRLQLFFFLMHKSNRRRPRGPRQCSLNKAMASAWTNQTLTLHDLLCPLPIDLTCVQSFHKRSFGSGTPFPNNSRASLDNHFVVMMNEWINCCQGPKGTRNAWWMPITSVPSIHSEARCANLGILGRACGVVGISWLVGCVHRVISALISLIIIMFVPRRPTGCSDGGDPAAATAAAGINYYH